MVLADIDESAVRSAAEELVSAGHKAIGVHCDVADEAGVAAMVERTITTFGRLDAAFNNAGIQSPVAETADASGEDFDRVAICPGVIETPMVSGMLATQAEAIKELMRDVPIGRLGQPEEIAAAVLWLCSPGASFVIGHALAIDGGYTVR